MQKEYNKNKQPDLLKVGTTAFMQWVDRYSKIMDKFFDVICEEYKIEKYDKKFDIMITTKNFFINTKEYENRFMILTNNSFRKYLEEENKNV